MEVDPDREGEGDAEELQTVPANLLCEICCLSRRQYKCPRCSVFSCSLECCKRHKVERACDGRRDRTSYVSIQTFSNTTLRNDYHFLEDVLQTKDSAKRTLAFNCGGLPSAADRKRQHRGGGKHHGKRQRGAGGDGEDDVDGSATCGGGGESILLPGQRPQQQLDSHTQGVRNFVKGAASSGRNTQVIVLPQGMSRRKANTSQYRGKNDEVLWRVHAVFVVFPPEARGHSGAVAVFDPSLLLRPELEPVSAEGIATNALLEQDTSGQSLLAGMALGLVHEKETLQTVLLRLLDPAPGNSAQRNTLRNARQDHDSLICLVQSIPSPASRPVFVEVSLEGTLRDALAGKTVIEYPTLIFAFPEHVRHLRRLVSGAVDAVDELGDAGSPSKLRRCGAEGEGEVEGGEEREGEGEGGGEEKEDDDEEEDEEEEQSEFFAALRDLQGRGVAELEAIAAGTDDMLLSSG